MTQTELTFAAPEVDPLDVDRLCTWLRGRAWASARDIEAALGFDDRMLRALGEHAEGAILTGQKGYRLNDETVSAEEVARSAQWKISQGKKMIRRGLAEKRHHIRLLTHA